MAETIYSTLSGDKYIKLYVRAAAGSATGSIQRVCAGHTTNASQIDNWTSGHHKVSDLTSAQNVVWQTSEQAIDIPAGTCVDGPFIAIGTDADPMIIYHYGDLTNIDD